MIGKFNILAFLFTALFLSPAAYSAPVTDNYANAILVSGNSGTVTTSNVGATKEPGEANVGFDRGGSSIWYKWVAPGNGVLKVDTTGTAINTLVGIYSGSTISTAKLLGGSDYCDCAYVGTTTGTTYYISLDGIYSAPVTLAGSITFNYTFLNSAPNDNFANAIQLFAGGPLRPSQITTTNVGSSKELGEPNHAGNGGGRSVWFKFQTAFIYPQTIELRIKNTRVGQPSAEAQTLMALYTGTSVGSLTPVQSFSSTNGAIVFKAQPNVMYRIAIDGFDAGQGADLGNFSLTWAVHQTSRMADFDGDTIADLSVYRPTTGAWYSLGSVDGAFRAAQWGANGDKPLVTDANNNGQSDFTVFRPDTGVWYLNGENNPSIFGWGLSTDIPMILTTYSPGLSVDRPVVFRPSTGDWWVSGLNARFNFGQNGDIPLTADFNGDGTDEFCIFRPSNGTWYIWNFIDNHYDFVHFGVSGDKPVPADFDGDGRVDIAVYRPSSGTWYVLHSADSSFEAEQFGNSTDIPEPVDYDGDSRSDFAIFRNGAWWIDPSLGGAVRVQNFGLSGDIPVTTRAN